MILLFLGACANGAALWVCNTDLLQLTSGWQLSPEQARDIWGHSAPEPWRVLPANLNGWEWRGFGTAVVGLGEGHVALGIPDLGKRHVRITDTGWPLRCQRYVLCEVTGQRPVLNFVRPLSAGWVVNTIFYAVLLWPVAFGPIALRRLLRRRRGQCAACGYPRGQAAVCSECGSELVVGQRNDVVA
jgi:hypothetical protein